MAEVLKITILCLTVLLIVLGVLLALPRSQLREALGWGGVMGNSALALSPLDLIPDFFPLIGQIDDLFYLVGIVLCALLIRRERRLRRVHSADPLEGQLVFPGFDKEIKPWQTKTIMTNQSESWGRVPGEPLD